MPGALSLSTASPPEAALVARAKDGDVDAFGELYRRFRPGIYRLALARLRDPTEADEIVQETFLRAWKSLARVDIARPLGPWLATIAANLVADTRRTRRRCVPCDPPEDQIGQLADTTEETVLALEESRRVRRIILSLPARQRRMLIATSLGGRTPAQVAEDERTSESSVTSAVYRARETLRRSLRNVTVITAWIRARLHRLRERAEDTAGTLSRVPVYAWEQVLAPALPVALVLLLGLGPRLPNDLGPDGHRETIVLRGPAPATASAAPSSAEGIAGNVPPDHVILPPARTPVRVRSSTGPTNDGAVAPEDGTVRIEVVGPDGEVLLYEEQEFECADQGVRLLPDDGPVRAAC